MSRARLVLAGAAVLLAVSGARAQAAVDETFDESIDLGGLACLDLAARIALPDPLEIAVKQASLRPAPC